MASATSQTSDLVDGLHKKARRALAENLAEDEKVLVVVSGGKNAAMIGTDRRVFVFKTGAQYGAMFGSKFASYEYRNISGVQLEFNVLGGGFAALDVAGGAPLRKGKEAAKAPNAIFVKKNDENRKAVADLRGLIADWHQRGSTQATPSPSGDELMAQIKQLGELRDQGLLTP